MKRINGLVALWALAFSALATPKPSAGFEHFTIEQGLSQSVGTAFLLDRMGFVWVGTQDGLNRFDGYRFKVFKTDPEDAATVSDSYIRTLFEDSRGTLWVGTDAGLNRYDRLTNRFSHDRHRSDDPTSLSNDRVWSICEDTAGALWIATDSGVNRMIPDGDQNRFEHYSHDPDDNNSLSSPITRSVCPDRNGGIWIGTSKGLDHLNPVSGKVTHYRYNPDDPNSISFNYIWKLLMDDKGKLWIGTFGGGLNHYNAETNTFTRMRHDPSNPNSISHDTVLALHLDDMNNLWLATFGGGLDRLNLETNEITHFRHDPSEERSLSNDKILSLGGDAQGGVWAGAYGGGINRYDPQREMFGHFRHSSSDPTSLAHNYVFAFEEDDTGAIWIGTDGGGLNKVVPGQPGFKHYRHDPNQANSIAQDNVWAIHQDRSGQIWIGTFSKGLDRFDPKTNRFHHYRHDANDPNTLTNNAVWSIHEDRRGDLWVGTNSGINRLGPDRRQIQRFYHEPDNPNSISTPIVLTVYEDQSDTLWLGTDGGGLNKLDRNNNRFIHYRADPNDPNGLSHDRVWSLFEDQGRILWVGTDGGGLGRLNQERTHFTHYRIKQGLANDSVYGILEDEFGDLWLSTNMGLSRFNPRTETFSNYTVEDGLQNNEFNQGSYFKSSRGELFFGGLNGFNRFFAKNIKSDPKPPPVVFTNLLLLNQPVPVRPTESTQTNPGRDDKTFMLEQSIETTGNLTLSWQENLVTFEFTALYYNNPNRNQYAYKMEGLNDVWVYTDYRNRRATFTNMPPGTYRLRVKAANKDGPWNEHGAQLQVRILPAPWKSGPAIALYVLILFAFIGWYLFQQREKLERTRQIAEQQRLMAQQTSRMMEQEREVITRLRQLDKLKDEFLANTSHELRTPLNGIIGLAESLMDGITGDLPKETNRNLAMIATSGYRLAGLVNNILDFSKLRNRGLELNCKSVDLVSIVNVVLTFSKPLIKGRHLDLLNEIPAGSCVNADEDRLYQILYNLVGNAVKYTESGSIRVTATPKEKQITISVRDTGIGIAPEQHKRIFESFEQVEDAIDRGRGGTGLGLAVTRQLVELHGGSIWVESYPGHGATFNFTLPRSDEPPSEVFGETISKVINATDTDTSTQNPSPEAQASALEPSQRFGIMIVDDEPINRQVLANHLKLQSYTLVEASSGPEALEILAREDHSIDLILLDIMMPHMSGYEVCQHIREHRNMHDLPIIYLSARNQVNDLVTGFECGANDYLTKPIAKNELISRVNTHLRLLDTNRNLERKVNERTRELKTAHQELLAAAHEAGMAEIAGEVMHTVGNKLNSLKTSGALILDGLHQARLLDMLHKIPELLAGARGEDLLSREEGRENLISAIRKISDNLRQKQELEVREMKNLNVGLGLIQDYLEEQFKPTRGRRLVIERINPITTMEETLQSWCEEHPKIEIIRDFAPLETLELDVFKFRRLIYFLLENAYASLKKLGPDHPSRIRLITVQEETRIRIELSDNGEPMAQQDKDFRQGLTAGNHALHYCGNAVNVLSGDIKVLESEEPWSNQVRIWVPMVQEHKG